MEIRIESLLEGAQRATGAVAVIDVLRAFTTAAVAFANGASHIVMVGSVDEALALRARGIGDYCIGETKGHKPPAFDFGNSPFEMSHADVRGKVLLQRTSAGTQGIVAAASRARHLFAAALVTASATARALKATGTDPITLVAMGDSGEARTDEDELCALHLRARLLGRSGDPAATAALIRASGDAERFGDPNKPHLDPRDLDIALDVDRYDFALRATIEDGRPVVRRL
ncbi:MAG: 2-phosphosulfolactate phosphatase [Rhodospirillales bacterium]